MSWLSKGLAKVGISTDLQRKVLNAAGPVTGGLSKLLVGKSAPAPVPAYAGTTFAPAVSPPVSPPVDINSAIAQGFATFFGGMRPTAPTVAEPVKPPEGVTASAPQPIDTLQKWGMPMALGLGGVLLAALLLRR